MKKIRIFNDLTIKKCIAILTSVMVVVVLLLPVHASAAEENNATSMVNAITVDGGVFTTKFKPGNFIYSIYFPEFQENIQVKLDLNENRFQYTVKGNKRLLRDGDNVVTVTVTDPDGVFPDEKYTLNIFFETQGLTYLDVENGIFSPQFDKFQSVYYGILENQIDTFEKAGVNWKTVNKDAIVTVECMGELNEDGTLPEGKRTQFKISVVETDGVRKEYRLLLYRKSSLIPCLNEQALLESLKINGGVVRMPTFKKMQAFYDVYVPLSAISVDIQAFPVDKSNIVEVIGSTVLRKDQPIYITVKVTSDSGDVCSYYILRCQYDTALYTKKHTKLQLIFYTMTGLTGGVFIGCAGMFIAKKARKIRKDWSVECDDGAPKRDQ